jgi:hypothetical protein
MSPRTAALVSGVGMLLMALFSPFAFLTTYQNIMVSGDATATAANIIAAGSRFNIGITIFLLVAILDVVVAWALYELFKPVDRSFSLLAGWLRLAYAPVFALSLTNLVSASKWLGNADYQNAFEMDQLNAYAMQSVGAFRSGWDIGLAIFGLHLLVLGYLAIKSGFLPSWLGVLLVVASIGYLVDSFGRLLWPEYSISLAQFTFVGEVLLIFWLIRRGVQDPLAWVPSGSS